MSYSISDLTHRLAGEAETVCRHYLSNGRREGRYWMIGDVHNTPGRSMFVRLIGPTSGKGAAGRWTDAASGEYGDLLDIIRETCGLSDFKDVANEARRFLSLPHSETQHVPQSRLSPGAVGSPEAARRLISMTEPIIGTLAERYLQGRGITMLQGLGALRFHPRCFYRPDPNLPTETWPALIASVTDLKGTLTGAHRTWLDPGGYSHATLGKAPIDTPRRAMGNLLGNAVRFGSVQDVMMAGEGIETILSLRMVLPDMPMIAALSGAHLAAIQFPPGLSRLYIARDNDPAGDAARDRLIERAKSVAIQALTLSPQRGDFNEDLVRLGLTNLRGHVVHQLMPEEAARFTEDTEAAGKEMRYA